MFSTHSIPLGTAHDAVESVTAHYVFGRLDMVLFLMVPCLSEPLAPAVASTRQEARKNKPELRSRARGHGLRGWELR